MAKFPVEIDDTEGIVDAVNNLLSGPSGLGQNFAGFSSYAPAYLTGNYRTPFTTPQYYYKKGSGSSGSTTLNVYPNANELYVGIAVSGPEVPAGTTVSSIGTNTGTYTPIVLSAALTGNASQQNYVFGPTPVRNLYVAPINLATAEFVDSRTIKFTFASAQPTVPFEPGNPITITGSSVSWYDGSYTTIGVVSCTTTYCYVRLSSDNTPEPIGTGGTIKLTVMDTAISTDCNARVTVTGGTDRVFISGQLDQKINYTIISGNHDLTVKVAVNRYVGFLNSDPVNPDYLFVFDGTVAEKDYVYTNVNGTGTLPLIETIFSTLLDQPNPNYYWYILEVTYIGSSSDVHVTSVDFGLRSLSTQVVKQ